MTADSAPRVLVAGVSTRAAAESAARAGYTVTALDAFADLDQHGDVRALAMPRDFGVPYSAAAASRAAVGVESDAVAYLSSFENHPASVRRLAAGRALWGNRPEVLARVRDPMQLAAALAARGLPGPAVRDRSVPDENAAECRAWLVKPRASGGGNGVRGWRCGSALPRGAYLQERIEGTPGSVVFVAAGGRAVPLGVSRQIVGEAAFGAAGYRYCGSVLAPAGDPQFDADAALVERACAMAHALAIDFALTGVNGVDFIARDGVPYPIEVNPRWCASMELVERAYGVSVFALHADACARGRLPAFDLARARRRVGAVGKAIVYARRDVAAGDTRGWLDDASVRDVPRPGERIAAGAPVCTVFAEGRDGAACHAALVRRADEVYAALAAWEREAA